MKNSPETSAENVRPTFFARCLVIAFAAVSILSCGGEPAAENQTNQNRTNTNQAKANTSSVKDGAESLQMVVNLPFEPQEVVWREEPLGKETENSRLPSLNEKKLTAVLLFRTEDAEKIVAQAQSYKPPASNEISPEDWFPAELVAQSQISGDETIKGTVYDAKDFFQAPYLDGKITRIENSNYFVLELISK